VLIIPSSWGSQLDSDLHHQHRAASRIFLAPLPGKKKTSAREVLLYFIFACIVLSKTHTKLVSFIVSFIYLLLVLLE
jgi:hypothetical protein